MERSITYFSETRKNNAEWETISYLSLYSEIEEKIIQNIFNTKFLGGQTGYTVSPESTKGRSSPAFLSERELKSKMQSPKRKVQSANYCTLHFALYI